jgi:hypothetical protein
MHALLATLSLLFTPPALALDEATAARETHIPGLRLHPASAQLRRQGVWLAYVQGTVSPGRGRYTCGGMTPQQVDTAADIAVETLSVLPAAAWRRIDLKYLLLCSETLANGREIGGMPVPPLKLLMLATGDDPANNRFAVTLLHELYHLIELQNGGLNDPKWDRLYSGYDGGYGDTAGDTDLGSGGAGFINGYGRSLAHEERAEIFALHLLAGDDLNDHITQTNDTTLKAKRAFVQSKCNQMLGRVC